MKKILLLCLLMVNYCFGAGIVEKAGKKLPETKVIFKSFAEEKEEQLKTLKDEKVTLETEKETILKNLKSDIEENNNKRVSVQRELLKYPDDEFLTKKLTLLTELQDMLNDMVRSWENVIKKINDHIGLIEKYLKDNDLKEYKKNLKISSGPYFFEDLEDIYQKLISQQKSVEQLKKRHDNVIKEQKNQIALADKLAEEYKDKKAQLDAFAQNSSQAKTSASRLGLTVQQRAELLNLEVTLAKLKKDLADLQVKEKKQELALVDNELFVQTLYLDVLVDTQRIIKNSITVTSEQIEASNQELEKKKHAFSLLKTRYNDEITKQRRLREEEEKRLVELSKKYGIPLGNELEIWSWQPRKTLESYIGLCEIGLLNTYIHFIEDRETLLQTIIALEQEKINCAEEIVKIKETYYKIAIRKFSSEDEIVQEIRKYTERQAAHEVALKSYKAKKDEFEAAISRLQQEILDRIKKRKTDIQNQRETLFKNHLREYAICLSSLDKAEEYIGYRIDFISATNKAYTETIQMLEKIGGYSRFILTELESITIWYRPEHAITWNGLQNVGTDIRLFLNELWSYIWQIGPQSVLEKFKNIVKYPKVIFGFLVKALLFLVLFILIHRTYLSILLRLQSIGHEYWALQFLANCIAVVLGYIARYRWLLYGWLLFWLALTYQDMPDPYIQSIFYLVSIPYLLYCAYRFIYYLIDFNISCNYCLISEDFKDRFIIIFSIITYTTIVCMLLRDAFVLAKLPRSELPSILSAINSIIFQVAFIFLLTKEYVLNIIPSSWALFSRWIDRYYYLFMAMLILVFVLSNTYVGYGRLVVYLLLGALYTIILVQVLIWSHAFIKKTASQFFFTIQEDVVRERFAFAKTWFGFTIIVSFTMLAIIGLVTEAKIWGWNLTFHDVFNWFNVPLLGIGKGTSSPLTIITIATILTFILCGFLIAYAFNRFVLEKIFDLMLVESGVQHAITSLIRYVLVAAAVVIGFQSVGYGGLLTYLYVLILGIGYLIQNPLNDFIAYFIILLQRPIKVGDFIQIDAETLGIVRKITPKSVVLRRKNSTTIVVPNTQIINKAVTNWNYSRNFIAFDDIIVAVGYTHDPARVKDLLLTVVDAHPQVLKNPKPIIRLDDFKEYGFEFMVRGFISANLTLEKNDIASDVRLALVKVLREHGIDLAVPVRIVVKADENKQSDILRKI